MDAPRPRAPKVLDGNRRAWGRGGAPAPERALRRVDQGLRASTSTTSPTAARVEGKAGRTELARWSGRVAHARRAALRGYLQSDDKPEGPSCGEPRAVRGAVVQGQRPVDAKLALPAGHRPPRLFRRRRSRPTRPLAGARSPHRGDARGARGEGARRECGRRAEAPRGRVNDHQSASRPTRRASSSSRSRGPRPAADNMSAATSSSR